MNDVRGARLVSVDIVRGCNPSNDAVTCDGNSLNPARSEYGIGGISYRPDAASDVNRCRVHAISGVKLQGIDDASECAVIINRDGLEPAIVVRTSVENAVTIARD